MTNNNINNINNDITLTIAVGFQTSGIALVNNNNNNNNNDYNNDAYSCSFSK